ncbi:MAG: hypothetical protein KA154_18665 [Gemmatimonadaceae bacterium]|nr:hypothetical protein [Gemmatimonadaceae bacterium]
MRQKLTGPALRRAASGVEVLDADKRTFRISFSSDEPYLRASWFDEPWLEILGHDADEVDMSRIDGGAAPLLWGHDSYSRDAHIGVVEKAWLEGGRGHAEVRLSSRADLDSLWSDIQDGVIRNVSVGYRIEERTLVRANSDGPNEYRVTRWQPMELSLVSVPADPSVGVGRNADDNATRFTITNMETRNMTTTTETPVQTPAAPAASVASAEEVREAATRAERERISMIRAAVSGLDIPAATVDQWIADGKTVPDCRAEIIEALKRKETPMNPRISIGEDLTRAAVIGGVESAILSRMTGGKVEEIARPYAYASFIDMARAVLAQTGRNVSGLPRHEIASQFLRAHSTSDFPYILANVANKRMQRQYAENVPSYARWARRAPNAPDFKTISVNQLANNPALSLKVEGAEVTYGTVSEKREQYTIATYARGLAVTREMIVNDDLRAFDRAITGFAGSARRLENSLVYQQLTANGNMSDGVALFHATHANLSTGATTALDATNAAAALAAARKLLRKQTGMASEILNLTPRYIIVPAALEQTAYQFTSANYTPSTPGSVNEFRAGGATAVEPIVEALLDATSAAHWYMAADSSQVDTVEYCYLEGAEGVYVEQMVDFDTDGIKVKARLDFAAKVIDWRGLVRSNGS